MIFALPELLTDPAVPKGVRRYFLDYAKTVTLFGRQMLVISQRLHWNHEDEARWPAGSRQGVGPGHSGDLRRYENDMPKRQDTRQGAPPRTFYAISVNEWMREHPTKVQELHEVGERHDYGGDD